DGVRSIPGVQAATIAQSNPAEFSVAMGGLQAEGRELAAGDSLGTLAANDVSSDFFTVTRIPIKQGRGFSPGAVDEAIVNEALAPRLWPNANPIGTRIRRAGRGPWLTIVGIAGNIRLPSHQAELLHRDLQFYTSRRVSSQIGTLIIRSELPTMLLDSAV